MYGLIGYMQYVTHKLHSNFVNSMSNGIFCSFLFNCWYVKHKAKKGKYQASIFHQVW